MKAVIVGGIAAGLKAASKIIRLKPDTELSLKRAYCSPTPDAALSGEIKES